MSQLSIETATGQTAFEPGAEIDVYLEWELENEPDAVELRLVWNTVGKGDTDLDVVQTERFEFPSPSESRRTTLTLPASPYSFSGKLISLVWALELVALPGGDSARKVVTIAPGGREVVLTRNNEETSSW